MQKNLLKSGLVVSIMTFLSRILGLVRDVVVAQIMGAGVAADVFFFANKIPNFLRRLFAEGAFAQAFIPVLTEVKNTRSNEELRQFVAQISGTLGIIVFFTAVIAMIGSPVVVAIFGTGWFIDYVNDGPDKEKFELASQLLKITFPYLFFISLTGLAGAILNTLNRFAVAAFTPVLLNVSIILCAIFLTEQFANPAYALAWGVFLGGAIQLLFQIPFLLRVKMCVWPTWNWHAPYVKRVRTLMIPALFGVSVSQINLLLDTLLASFLITGSISWLYYSDRLLEFPLGLFGIAIATVILPALSRDHVARDDGAFQSNLDWALRMVSVLGIPAAVALAVLALPLISVLFQRGEFTHGDAIAASYSLTAYAAGLFSFMLVKVLAPAFYARQDIKTPVRFGIMTMVANMVFNLLLIGPLGYIGLAMATTLSATMNAVLLAVELYRQGRYKPSLASMVFMLKVVLASSFMGIGLWWYDNDLDWSILTFEQKVGQLVVLIFGGLSLYVFTLICCGVRIKHLRDPA